MATTDEGSEMDGSTAGGLDALELPELPDAVWMRLLANALDPDAPAADPGLIPVDEVGTPADDLSGWSDGVLPDDDPDDGADAADAGGDHHDDGGAALLPHPDPAPEDHVPGGGHSDDPLGGHPWSDPHGDHGF